MPTRIAIPLLLVSWVAGVSQAQIRDPIAEPIVKRGLSVEIREIARLPDTSGLYPEDMDRTGRARISYVRDLADGRRFVNDSRGFLYLLEGNQPSQYLDVGAAFPLTFYNSLTGGFVGFDFHPEFDQNGLFYTTHAERAMRNPATPHFLPPGFAAADATYHSVITEWRATNPAANVFSGTRRELLRVGHVVMNFRHPITHLEFNPTAGPGDVDYGLL